MWNTPASLDSENKVHFRTHLPRWVFWYGQTEQGSALLTTLLAYCAL
jgi:hypothetical protein